MLCIRSRPLYRAKLKIYLKFVPTKEHFGNHFVPINIVFNEVYGPPYLTIGLHCYGRSA